jgi:hypothetical protein
MLRTPARQYHRLLRMPELLLMLETLHKVRETTHSTIFSTVFSQR